MHRLFSLPGESYEALWEHLYAFLEDTLLTPYDSLTHTGGGKFQGTEKISQTMLNILTVQWLYITDNSLPQLVRVEFATALQNTTIYTVRESISASIPTLLQDAELASINRAFIRNAIRCQPQLPDKHRPGRAPTALC